MVERVCVFCGSNAGREPVWKAAAVELGSAMGMRKKHLVYGGSHLGLMGAITDAVLANGGRVTGVVPRLLVEKEAAYTTLDDLRIVETMHERKALMVDLAQGFVSMPGAFGTLDELFECVTWAQLRIHQKPVVIWNLNGFYDPLLRFLDGAVEAGFLREQHRGLLRVAGTVEEVFAKLDEPVEETGGKWLPTDIR
jgi:uncharacterized protein (TIGR00730 family)